MAKRIYEPTENAKAIIDFLKTAKEPMTFAEIKTATNIDINPATMTALAKNGYIEAEMTERTIMTPIKRTMNIYKIKK